MRRESHVRFGRRAAETDRPQGRHRAAARPHYVKVRDGQVGNQPFYAAIGVDLAGRRDVLGLWAGTSGAGESAKFWLAVLTDLRNRGVRDVFFVVCDGLKGLPDSVATVFPAAIVQTSSVHHRGSGRVPLVTRAVPVRTCANELPSRSIRRPVRPGRWRPCICQQEQRPSSAEMRSRRGRHRGGGLDW